MKKCNKCNIDQELDSYFKDNKSKDLHENTCKGCRKISKADYYVRNKEIINLKNKDWKDNNKNKLKEYNRKYSNLESDKERRRKYKFKNKDKLNKQDRERSKENRYKRYNDRYNSDPVFKLRRCIKSTISGAIIRMGFSKNSKTMDILGCSIVDFKFFIENKFKENMSWDNYGEWHLDHITPISYAKSEEEVINLNHYTNFQPLWAKENLSKGNKYIG